MKLPVLIVMVAAIVLPIQAQTPRAAPHPPTPPYGAYPQVWTQRPRVFDVQALNGGGSYLGVGLFADKPGAAGPSRA